MVIWACVDPTNFYVPTSSFSIIIALAYAMIIWGYAPIGIAANTARDVGGRMMAVAIWGSKASGGAYAAIAALTNILATFVALIVYEAIFTDSSRGTKSFDPPQISRVLTSTPQSSPPIAASTWVPRWPRSSTATATFPPPIRVKRSTPLKHPDTYTRQPPLPISMLDRSYPYISLYVCMCTPRRQNF